MRSDLFDLGKDIEKYRENWNQHLKEIDPVGT
jgi:hypothetical protein